MSEETVAKPNDGAEGEPTVVLEAPEGAAAADSDGAESQNDTEAIEREALSAGWVPKDRWKHPASQWRDAATFVEARNRVLPVVRKENESLRRELAELRAETERLRKREQEQEAARETVTLESLKIERRQAMENQDYARVADLDDKLIAAAAKEAVKKAQPKQEAAPAVDPQIQETWNRFEAANDWAKTDRGKQVLMEQMTLMRQAGSQLIGDAMLEEAKDRVLRYYPEWGKQPARRTSMAESGGYNGAARGNSKTWGDLRPEAREALESFIESTPGLTKAGVLARIAKQADAAEYFRR